MAESRRLWYPEPPLADELVLLRPWEEADLACVERARTDRSLEETTTVYDEQGGLDWIHRQWARQENGDGVSLAITVPASGGAVGSVVLLYGPEPGVAELGYWLVPAARGLGYATRAVTLVAGWALRSAGFARVEALLDPGNEASRRVLERAGFVREGRLRSYLAVGDRRIDALVFALIQRDLPAHAER
jgi:RimJ/RimL family protein N-acetyltransferase